MVKKAANTQSMEEALHAAVARMNNGGLPPPSPPGASLPSDPMNLLMSVLPKLLNRDAEEEGEVEQKLEELKTEELKPLREVVAQHTEQLERIYRAQRVLLREVRALGDVVTGLADQLMRIELIEGQVAERLEVDPRSSRMAAPQKRASRL